MHINITSSNLTSSITICNDTLIAYAIMPLGIHYGVLFSGGIMEGHGEPRMLFLPRETVISINANIRGGRYVQNQLLM